MNKPKIVCLCGSTRFYSQFQEQNYKFTMEDKVVLSVGLIEYAIKNNKPISYLSPCK